MLIKQEVCNVSLKTAGQGLFVMHECNPSYHCSAHSSLFPSASFVTIFKFRSESLAFVQNNVTQLFAPSLPAYRVSNSETIAEQIIMMIEVIINNNYY